MKYTKNLLVALVAFTGMQQITFTAAANTGASNVGGGMLFQMIKEKIQNDPALKAKFEAKIEAKMAAKGINPSQIANGTTTAAATAPATAATAATAPAAAATSANANSASAA